MKGNRQGSLSCLIKRLFETLSEFQKVQQPVGKDFPTGCAGPLEHSRGPAFVQPQQPFSSRQVSGMGAGLLGGKNSLTGNFTFRFRAMIRGHCLAFRMIVSCDPA